MTLLVSERSLMIRSKFRSVLQLRLQHRRTREQLAEQGIMPPLKGPSAFFEQRRNLERAKTEDFLKHKIRSRPERSELVKMNILEDAVANPTQMKQKKARLADNLNEKILHRPGPLELVEKNIIPLNSTVKQAIKVGQIHLQQPSDPFPFEDDSSSSSNSSSPEQPGGHQSQSMAGSPQQTAKQPTVASCPPLQSPLGLPQRMELSTSIPEPGGESNTMATSGQLVPILPVLPVATGPPRAADPGKLQRQKKPKEPKPKVKKLKYHQYVPPDQKAERSPVAMDAAYSRLLQQQQIFLQLQILNQQQQSFSIQAIQPSTPGLPPDQIIGFASAVPAQAPCVPLSPSTKSCQRTPTTSSTKPELLPANLDDLTVSELRQQLRKRGLPVSGTKPALLERLKPYQVCSPKPAPPSMGSSQLSGPLFEAPGPPAREGPRLPPPTAGKEDVTSLVEKEKAIERLTWKLQQEQQQAEDLRLELELRKRRHHQAREASARPLEAPLRTGLLAGPAFHSLGYPQQQQPGERAFPRLGLSSETSRPGSPVALGYGRGPAQAPSAATTCDPEGIGRPPSPSNPFFFSSSSTSSSSSRAIEATGGIDNCNPSPQQRPHSSSPSQGHSRDGSLSDLLVPRPMQPEFRYSPASLHSFFTLEDAEIDAKNESSSEENFESEVYLSASLGPEGRGYGSLEALASSDSGGFHSLEEELTEAIKSAELSQSQSIEDILEEHLMSTDPSPSLDQGLPESPPASLASCPASPDYLREGERPEARRAGRNSPAELLPGLPQYDVFGVSDVLAGPFSPMCVEADAPCLSPERPAKAELTEIAFDPADWIDPLPGHLGPGSGLGNTSIFSTDFLDAPDLNINRMIDLLVEQW